MASYPKPIFKFIDNFWDFTWYINQKNPNYNPLMVKKLLSWYGMEWNV